MSISSISATAPAQPAYMTTTPSTPPVVNTDSDNNDAGAIQPAAPAPLPPGQGTRFDQLV